MSGASQLAEFFNLPTTVDLVIRRNELILNYAEENPDILLTRTLLDRYVIIYINRDHVEGIAGLLGTSIVSAMPYVVGLLDLKAIQDAGIYQVQQQPYLDLKGGGVLIGIVDTGIDYTKDTFIYEDGTSKIQYIYDQTAEGIIPEGFIGAEYTNAQINAALKSENPYDFVPHRDTVGHGTFLASVAAGRQDNVGFIGAAPDAELIVVKLRKARQYYLERYLVPPEQENAFESSAVMVGVDYIIKRAMALNRPVAICIGVGTNQGAHDGFSMFEEFLSQAGIIKGVCICTAAGNESDAKHHFQGRLTKKGEAQNIDISVGGNAGDVYMEIYNTAADRFSISVRSPTGELVGLLPAISGTIQETKLALEDARVILEYYFPLQGSGSQVTRVKLINATPGIWTITVYGDIVLDGTYHAWLPITGFVSPSVGFLTPSPYTTVVVPASTVRLITCGAYDGDTNSLYVKSSWGPTRNSLMVPDLVAPGVNVGGIFPAGYGMMDGTSVSTAITTGAGALLLQWGIVEGNDISMNTHQVRAYLIRGCTRSTTISYPNYLWGYGSLNLIGSLNLMRQL